MKTPSALKLLSIIEDHEMLNVNGTQATACIHMLVHMLTQDAYWTEEHITTEDAAILSKAFLNIRNADTRTRKANTKH